MNRELIDCAEQWGWYVVKFEKLFGADNRLQMACLFEQLGMGKREELIRVDYINITASNTSEGRVKVGSSDVKFSSDYVSSQVSNKLVLERVADVGIRLEKLLQS